MLTARTPIIRLQTFRDRNMVIFSVNSYSKSLSVWRWVLVHPVHLKYYTWDSGTLLIHNKSHYLVSGYQSKSVLLVHKNCDVIIFEIKFKKKKIAALVLYLSTDTWILRCGSKWLLLFRIFYNMVKTISVSCPNNGVCHQRED